MTNREMIRKLFQTMALIFFLVQFHQSVRKYFSYPVVEQTSQTLVENLPPPVVYICQDSQFNYSVAKSYGYQLEANFMAGILNNYGPVTWKGKYGNLTFKDLEKIIFDHDYQNLIIGKKSRTTNKIFLFLPVQQIFLFPHGICLKMLDVEPKPWFYILPSKKTIFMLVDPARANSLRTEETQEGHTMIGIEKGSYEIEYTLNDDSIHDGITCTDYTKLESSYDDCLSAVLREELLSAYGCLPPWFKERSLKQKCGEANFDVKSLETIVNVLMELFSSSELKMFERCLPPCTTLLMKLQRTHYTTMRVAFIDAKSKDWATVHTLAYSYDIFSLTVDLGSALGLWLGLSCLSILDYILIKWNFLKNYWNK